MRAALAGPRNAHPAWTFLASLLSNLADLYINERRYAEAEPLLNRSLAIAEKVLGPDHPNVAQTLNNLAMLYDRQGRYADAERLLKRSLAASEKTLGPNHPDLADLLDNLAGVYKDQGRTADAEQLHRRSTAIREKAAAKPIGTTNADLKIFRTP
jgi:tetratricopeptide (TPR) repeat protein